MIFVTRVSEPAILVRNSQKWTKAYLVAIKNLKTSPEDPKLKRAKQIAENKYKQKAIRMALNDKMFHGKCAYCESRIAHDQKPPIEHFYPKSKYPKRCFVWKNLLWGCGECNGSEFKGDKFPTRSEGGPLIDPTKEEPSKHLTFDYDEVAGTAIVGFKTKRGETTRNFLGLNRNELIKTRSMLIEQVAFIATKAANGEDWALSILKRACDKSSSYAAFARAIADRFGIDWKTNASS